VAGTDRGREIGGTGAADQPVFVLVRPQLGENIGAAARAMLNFGLDRMRLVAPRDGWPNPAANAMASGAGRVLERARVHETTAEACADLTHVFATTARDRALTLPVLTPEQAMAEARAIIAGGGRVGVLFGPERAGLETPDVARANAVISVPVNRGFGSLNLAQCVLLVAYDWMRSGGAAPGPAVEDWASGIELDRFLEHLTGRLEASGYFFPEQNRASMMLNVENLFRRTPLTAPEIRTLHGILRALARNPGAPE
jgi:tRNA/rRNA methyltransferase